MTPYYEQDDICIYHGDCGEILPLLPEGTVDLVFTSPPYNLGNTTGGGFPIGHYTSADGMVKRGGQGKWPGASLANGYETFTDDMPHEEYVAWQHDILRKCWGLLTDTGAIFYNHKPRVMAGICVTPLEYVPDLPVRQIIIWERAGGINFSPAFYLPTHEWVVIIAKSKWRLRSKGASGVGDVWQVAQESNKLHPAPFPLRLVAKALDTTLPGTVLDPFMGSGTTLVAAKKAGRRAIGIDVSERYCEIAANRLRQKVLFAGETA